MTDDSTINRHGNSQQRYFFPVFATDGVGYTDADNITLYIYPGVAGDENNVAGYLYVYEVMANEGLPAPWAYTAGTAQTYAAPQWTISPRGKDRNFDLVVISWGANDSTQIPLEVMYTSLCAAIKNALMVSKRVVVVSPPPLAAAGLAAWADDYVHAYYWQGYHDAMKRACRRYNVDYYDAITEFKALVTAGTRTIAQLMFDTVHPSYGDAATDGLQEYIDFISDYISSAQDLPRDTSGPDYHVRLLGEVTSGTFAYDYGLNEIPNGLDLIAGGTYVNNFFSRKSAVGTEQLTFPVPGDIIALVGRAIAGTSTVAVVVDSASPVTVDMGGGAAGSVPKVFYVGSGYGDGEHTVTVTVATGTVQVLGMVGITGK